MKKHSISGFPGGSRSNGNRAGDSLRRSTATPTDSAVLDEWRAAHGAVLSVFPITEHDRARRRYSPMIMNAIREVVGMNVDPDLPVQFHSARGGLAV